MNEDQMMAVEPPVEKPKRQRPSRARVILPPLPPPEREPTFDERLEASKKAARQLAKEKRVKIPFRAGLSLELHELLVAIAQKIGGSGVVEVGLRAMEVGAEHWARSIKLRVDENVRPLTTFERTPSAYNTQDYGVDEQRVRDELAAEAAQRAKEHAAQADQLHLTGRRRANAG
jgi:hypothetical protein